MSTTLHLAQQTATTLAAEDGILDWGSAKATEALTVLRLFGTVLAVGFVLYQGVASRGALARIIISGIAAGVFVWIIWNVDDLRDRVDNEVNSAPAASTRLVVSAADLARAPDARAVGWIARVGSAAG